MAGAKKCHACSFFYNTSVFSECPYCKEAEKKKKKNVFGDFVKRITKSESSDETIETLKETPVNDEEKEDSSFVEKEKDVTSQLKDVRKTVAIDHITGTVSMASVTTKKMSGDSLETEKKENDDYRPVKNESSDSSSSSLTQAISRSGRTVGKYISNKEGESIAPVVGWLVAVKGSCLGQSFNLKKGRNKVGRSHEMDVKLLSDESVSRSCVAIITYDAKAKVFSIQPGDSDDLCYVNDTAVYDRTMLNAYDAIEFGDSGYNKYIFVPFCGDKFQWEL